MISKIKTESREAWQELRSHYIGGSDAAAVVGLNAFSSPYALCAVLNAMESIWTKTAIFSPVTNA